MSVYPREAYQKANYNVLTIDFTKTNPFIAPVHGDYLDVLSTDQDITQITIQLNYGDPITLDQAIPVISPFSHLIIYNKAGNTGYLKLIIGAELYRSQRQNVSIVNDKVGLVKTSDITGELIPNNINVNVGTTPTPIASTPTLVSMLIVQNNSTTDVSLGNASLQNIKIPANGGVISLVLPMGKKMDLNKLYLVASASTTVAVMYWR
jgi:hypothetical protein